MTTATPTRTPVRPHITNDQIDHCHPTYDFAHNEWFYQVESESDPLAQYEVRYHQESDSYTCTCKCGEHAFASCRIHRYCKHVYWCCAHYQRYLRAEVAPVTEVPPHSDVFDHIDAEVENMEHWEEESWLNDVAGDMTQSNVPALFVPPAWIN